MARATSPRTPLTADEREGITRAVDSVFRKLKNLYSRIVPIFEDFRVPSSSEREASAESRDQLETMGYAENTSDPLYSGFDLA
jgi:hypothetical protein